MPSKQKPASVAESRGGTPQQNLASTVEVAQFLGVPVNTLYQWSYRGIGPRVLKVGRHARYRWPDVESWLEERPQAGGGS